MRYITIIIKVLNRLENSRFGANESDTDIGSGTHTYIYIYIYIYIYTILLTEWNEGTTQILPVGVNTMIEPKKYINYIRQYRHTS
jgi:hypothetical protein